LAVATTTSTSCPSLPSSIPLPTVTELPNPFEAVDGSQVTTKDQWDCRQQEINALFQLYELGRKPDAPSVFTPNFSDNTLSITAGDGTTSISFTATITYPSGSAASYPALIAFQGGSLPVPSGVAVINFNNDDIAAENDATSRGVGKFYTLYGADATASAMMAWSWGVSRIIDALETLPVSQHKIDVSHLGVTGCSRDGKGAFVAGAFDTRIALTIPQESGSGGSACWRLSDYSNAHPEYADGQAVQGASEIVQENVWFSDEFANQFANDVPTLPIDHHSLAALVAPRGLLVIENTAYEWLGPWSCYGCMKSATKVYEALGVSDNMGFSQIGGHAHCSFPSSQQSDLDAYVNKFLFDQSTNTTIFRSDLPSNETFDESTWAPWIVPTLT
jgi:hypothetical protein